MIRYLIKNNFKLMFRNTWSLVLMIIGPILVIAILSSAFSELMKSYEGVDEFTVGYRVNDTESEIATQLKLAGEEAGIIFYEYPEGDIKDTMEKNELAGFVEFANNSYVLYRSADYEVEGTTLEYFISKMINEGVNSSLQSEIYNDISLPVKELDFMPAVDSTDYYGIVYIVYFSWCGFICATGVLSNEKKYGIGKRFQVSNVSEIQNYFGKFIPVVLTIGVGMLVSTLITVLLYGIHWGSPFLSMLILLMMILAGSALGLMLYNVFNNLVITIITQFTVVWFLGFFGGSFETYMFSGLPDILKEISPIYYGNRALVELSCMGESDYVVSSIIYSLAITIICSIIAILAGSIRKRGRA